MDVAALKATVDPRDGRARRNERKAASHTTVQIVSSISYTT